MPPPSQPVATTNLKLPHPGKPRQAYDPHIMEGAFLVRNAHEDPKLSTLNGKEQDLITE